MKDLSILTISLFVSPIIGFRVHKYTPYLRTGIIAVLVCIGIYLTLLGEPSPLHILSILYGLYSLTFFYVEYIKHKLTAQILFVIGLLPMAIGYIIAVLLFDIVFNH
ncbi:MAG: hypothetical protein GY827_04310 [Cytophagales bacterium]|nr:hypothetical protein [Cytophagales bacterium]